MFTLYADYTMTSSSHLIFRLCLGVMLLSLSAPKFSGFSVGSCINEEEGYQHELNDLNLVVTDNLPLHWPLF